MRRARSCSLGTVVEYDRPRRLVLTWADPDDAGDKSKHTRVSFDLERIDDDMVHLSVTHGELEED